MPLEVGAHKLTSGPVAFDFAAQTAFVDNPVMTITGVAALAAHDDRGTDVSDATFDVANHPHQITGLVVKVWINTPPGGTLKITLAVATLNDGAAGVEVGVATSLRAELVVASARVDSLVAVLEGRPGERAWWPPEIVFGYSGCICDGQARHGPGAAVGWSFGIR